LASFAEWGSTSGSVPNTIDLNRYPASGDIRYKRTMSVPQLVADLIRDGNAVIVVHGNDYNYNHVYDFAGLGVSDLDRTLPGDATAPALCGPLHLAPGAKSASARLPTTYVASLKPDIASPTGSSTAIAYSSAIATRTWPSDYGHRPNDLSLFCHIGHAWAIGS